jgi:hypothetical protein
VVGATQSGVATWRSDCEFGLSASTLKAALAEPPTVDGNVSAVDATKTTLPMPEYLDIGRTRASPRAGDPSALAQLQPTGLSFATLLRAGPEGRHAPGAGLHRDPAVGSSS